MLSSISTVDDYRIFQFITRYFLPHGRPGAGYVTNAGYTLLKFEIARGNFYIIGTHSNNVLIWFTKRILGTVFLCPYNVCPKSLTSSQIRQNL